MLTIRLSRIGKKKKPFYRVVVIESSKPRDGRVVELVGTYDPAEEARGGQAQRRTHQALARSRCATQRHRS